MTGRASDPETEARERILPPPLDGLVVVVLVLGVALLLREAAAVLVPLLFGAFMALVAWPLVGALERRGVGRAAALALTIVLILVVVVGAAVAIALSVGGLVALTPRYEDRLDAVIASVRDALGQFGIVADREALLSIVSPAQIATVVRSVAAAISNAGLALLVLVLTMSYALVGASSLRARAETAFGPDHGILNGARHFGEDLRRYLVVRAILGLIAAALVLVLLLVLGVPLPLLWAFLVFAASFIPNLGVILALIPPTLLGLLDGGIGTAAAVVVGYVAINFLQDNFLQPVVLGTELNLSPLVIFVAVVVWAWILGPAGALLAVPMTVGLVAILEAFPASRPIAALMRNTLDRPAGLGDPAAPPPDSR